MCICRYFIWCLWLQLHWISQAEANKQWQGEVTLRQQRRRRGMSMPVRLTQMIHADKSPAVSVSIYGLWHESIWSVSIFETLYGYLNGVCTFCIYPLLLVYYCIGCCKTASQGTGSLPLSILEEAGQECREEEPAVDCTTVHEWLKD